MIRKLPSERFFRVGPQGSIHLEIDLATLIRSALECPEGRCGLVSVNPIHLQVLFEDSVQVLLEVPNRPSPPWRRIYTLFEVSADLFCLIAKTAMLSRTAE
jgi:hypothetical protein